MQIRGLTIFLLFCLTSLVLTTNPLHAEVGVEASLSHLSFPEDRMAQLTVTVSGASKNADIRLPEIDSISLHNRGQSSQINMINGTITSSLSHNYLVQAAQPGQFTIPAIEVRAAGKSYHTEPIAFTVTASGQSSNETHSKDGNSLAEAAFLKISFSGEHYPGEIVPLTIKAYFSQKYRFDEISLPTLQGDGVITPQLNTNPIKSQEAVNKRMYHVLTWETSLSGIKVGEHPVLFSLNASLLTQQKRRSSSPFGGNSLFGDSLFDNFFSGYQRKPISLRSEETVFNVLPLPTDNQPAGFTGAIGTFDLKVSASPLNLEVGEPITLIMEISGTGNFDRVEAPQFPATTDWKTYSPTSDFSTETNNHSRTKVFEQAVVAKNPELSKIPALAFSYFDPALKDYLTITSAPIDIELRGSSMAPPMAQATVIKEKVNSAIQKQVQERFRRLAPIRLETGTFHKELNPLYKKRWFLAVSLLLLLILITSIFLKFKQNQKRNNPERGLLQQKQEQLANDIQTVKQAMEDGNSRGFCSACRRTIQNQLGILWHIEPSAISLTNLESKLHPDSPLLEIFAIAEEAAYGAVELSAEKMQDYTTKMTLELEKLA